MKTIKSNKTFTPKEYFLMLAEYFQKDIPAEVWNNCGSITINKLYGYMEQAGLTDLWDYPIDEIDHITENSGTVVLVTDSTGAAQWFEVPEDLNVKNVKRENNVYVVVHDSCNDGHTDITVDAFGDENAALASFKKTVDSLDIPENEEIVVDKTKDVYSAYKEGWYDEWHETVTVYKVEVQ